MIFSVLAVLTGFSGFLGKAHAEILEGKADLLALEKKVQEVVKTGQPATVALMDTQAGSSGTGVIVSGDGLVLTAAHVVDKSKVMTAILANGERVRGKVLGANYSKDVAMVQLEGKRSWPFAKMGDSDAMEVGDWVVVMGHAEGFNPGRTAPVRFGRLQGLRAGGYILSDCPMVGGDSGGPIFDVEGKVVGINSSIGQDLEYNNHAGISGLKKDFDRLKEDEKWGSLVQQPNARESPL